MPEIKIIAAVVDTTELTLYKEDGSTISILQGDPRLKRIVDECIVPIQTQGYAMVDLTKENTYRQFEERSGGLVRFFKVAKKALAGMFSSSEKVPDMVIGSVAERIAQSQKAVEEITKHAIPTSDPKFNEEASKKDSETIVAVVKDQIIPDVGLMEGHITRATKTDPKGMNTFMVRLSEVVKQRRHSVEELMRFMERGDLPIADDGTIVIYKVLRRKNEGYVDCHTGKVPQRVGSYVHMDAKLVDHNRSVECSNGLHVARRGYLGNFGGDVCVIAKVQPEDVITVPSYDANKMRVCGYHILFELDNDSYSKLKNNRPFTDNHKAQLLLGRAISGDHPPPHEHVTITGQNGEGVIVTPVNKPTPNERKKETMTPVEALSDQEATKADPVNPVEVAKKVEEAVQEASQEPSKAPVLGNRQQEARRLYDAFVGAKSGSSEERQAAQTMLAYKKAKKVSWASLGITSKEEEDLLAFLNLKKE